MNHLDLPNVSSAQLPTTYENAKTALSECASVDECKTWSDKAMALASYARQSKDESLCKLATRIQARAIRRMGALFKQIEPAKGKRTDLEPSGGAPTRLSRIGAAREAGISPDNTTKDTKR